MTGLHFQETYIGMKTTAEIKVNVNVNIISRQSIETKRAKVYVFEHKWRLTTQTKSNKTVIQYIKHYIYFASIF